MEDLDLFMLHGQYIMVPDDLVPGQHQAIIWINAEILSIRPLGSNSSEILLENSYIFIQDNTFENVCKMASNRRQAVIWTNADPIHWCIYVALVGDELMEWQYQYFTLPIPYQSGTKPNLVAKILAT